MLLKTPIPLENTKFIAGGLSLIISFVPYLPIGRYNLDNGKNKKNKII